MANNYYEATGIIMVEKVTPVIEALFGGYDLDPSYPGNGACYIRRFSEGANPSWESITEDLEAIVYRIGRWFTEAFNGELVSMAKALAEHYKKPLNDDWQVDEDGEPDIGDLFELAQHLDDGHGLSRILIEGSWTCSKPRLFEFGGHGLHVSKDYILEMSSAHAGLLGEDLQVAFDQENLERAADVLITAFNRLLNGVIDKEKRDALRARVIARLATTHGISKEARDYVNKCGNYCPACHSTQIEGGSIDINDKEAFQEASCNNCGSSWRDLYRLVGFDDLETG